MGGLNGHCEIQEHHFILEPITDQNLLDPEKWAPKAKGPAHQLYHKLGHCPTWLYCQIQPRLDLGFCSSRHLDMPVQKMKAFFRIYFEDAPRRNIDLATMVYAQAFLSGNWGANHMYCYILTSLCPYCTFILTR